MNKRKMLWVGDAGCTSGFARCTHEILATLSQVWDVSVLGMNYRGEPHDYPYPIYPAFLGGDLFGVKRVAKLVEQIKPDFVLLQNDVWNIPAYMAELKDKGVRVGAALAVDGKNCRGFLLNGLQFAIFWTEFARQEAISGGYTGPSAVIPLGVDTFVYQPRDEKESRRQIGMTEAYMDTFIVGNVNRNQHRKRLDLTIEYFAEWVKNYDVPDARLYLHVAPTGDQGFDCEQLAKYYGVDKRLILAEPDVFNGYSEEDMAATYNSFDVQLTTTQGEGWGLCTMEGMACGIPQIVPSWAALGEWPKGAVLSVQCDGRSVTPNFINSIGGVASKHYTVQALNDLYKNRELRVEVGLAGQELVNEPRFQWPNIGQEYVKAIKEFVYELGPKTALELAREAINV